MNHYYSYYNNNDMVSVQLLKVEMKSLLAGDREVIGRTRGRGE